MPLARPERSGGYDLAHARVDGGLEDEWAALADRVAAPASLYPGYLGAWAEAHSQTSRLIAVTARRDGELAAVLPLVLSRSRQVGAGAAVRGRGGRGRRRPRVGGRGDDRRPDAARSPSCCCGRCPTAAPPTAPWPPRPRGPGRR